MSKRPAALAFLAACACCAADNRFSMAGFLHNRLHPEIVHERPVEGLEAHIVDGKLVLTMKDYLELLLKNSTDIRIAQLDVYNSWANITGAKAPFDPSLTLQFNGTRTLQPEPSQISGASTLNSLSQTSSIGYNQVLGSGPTVNASYSAVRSSTNSQFANFNPSIFDSLNFQVTQPLLAGRGNLQLRTPLLVARTQLVITSEQSQGRIADLMTNAAGQYWEAIRARENIGVQQQSLDLARKSYERDKLALELGALSRLDIFQSESQVAQRKVAVIQAQYAYKEQLDGLRRQIGADLKPETRSMEIVLEDDPAVRETAFEAQPVDEAIAKAMRDRPELSAANRQVSIDEMNQHSAQNALLPRLDLSVLGGSSGLAGNQFASTGILGTAPTLLATSGIGEALSQAFAFSTPYYGFQVTLGLPIKGSAAKANLANSIVNRTRDRYTLRQLEQGIVLQVKTAANELALARDSVNAALEARELARKNVDAEQQKYELGTITAFELLDAQTRLASIESTVVDANVGYQKALIAYKRATWTAPYGGLDAVVATPKER